jgi:hypothetical protein
VKSLIIHEENTKEIKTVKEYSHQIARLPGKGSTYM